MNECWTKFGTIIGGTLNGHSILEWERVRKCSVHLPCLEIVYADVDDPEEWRERRGVLELCAGGLYGGQDVSIRFLHDTEKDEKCGMT
jgi:hypothetical protein